MEAGLGCMDEKNVAVRRELENGKSLSYERSEIHLAASVKITESQEYRRKSRKRSEDRRDC